MKNIYYYLSLPYTLEVMENEDGWFGRVVELKGCIACADTKDEVIEMLKDAMICWLEVAIDDGCEIPEPDLDYLNNSRVK